MSGATEDGENTRTWRHCGDVADIFSGPADPNWVAHRDAIVSTTNASRGFRQLEDLSVLDTFDDPLPDSEIAAWETIPS
jgi:hypothetical protein